MAIPNFGSITFTYTAIAFLAWFVFQDKKTWAPILSKATMLGLVLHIGSTLIQTEGVSKFSIITTDIIVLAAAGILFMASSALRVNKLIAGLLLLAGLFGYQKVRPILKLLPFSTAENKITSNTSEEYSEFLIQFSPTYEVEFDKKYANYIDGSESAFFSTSQPNTDLDDYFEVNVKDDKIEDFLSKIAQDPNIVYLEKNDKIVLDDFTSNISPSVENLISDDPMVEKQWALQSMGVAELQSILKKSGKKPKKKAKLAILDTGVDSKHEDIDANYTSTKTKYDTDKKGHGTHCAGIAGAVVNNATGVASPLLNKNLYEITSVKVLSDYGGGTQAGIIKGMIEAADAGADVISMSLGGFSSDAKQKAYSDAVKYCNDKGTIVVVAAGNSAQDATKYSPANADNVICVAATTVDGDMASFSNKIDNIRYGVYAPGKDILSTTPGDNYEVYSGTSMATPYTAALVTIMKAYKPNLSTEDAYQLLKDGINANSSSDVKNIDFGGSIGKLLQ